MNIQNHTRLVNIFSPYSLGFASNSLTPEIWKIGTEYLVSVDDVGISDMTVFQKVETYQSFEFAFSGAPIILISQRASTACLI